MTALQPPSAQGQAVLQGCLVLAFALLIGRWQQWLATVSGDISTTLSSAAALLAHTLTSVALVLLGALLHRLLLQLRSNTHTESSKCHSDSVPGAAKAHQTSQQALQSTKAPFPNNESLLSTSNTELSPSLLCSHTDDLQQLTSLLHAGSTQQDSDQVAKHIPEASVLFVGIREFTGLSSQWTAQHTFKVLHEVTCAFDELIHQHGCIKVDQSGGMFTVIAGHDGTPDHTLRAMRVASGMLARVAEPCCGELIQIVCGLHTGPIQCGMVGRIHPRMTALGDTLVTAMALQSRGQTGCVMLSASAAARLREQQEVGCGAVTGSVQPAEFTCIGVGTHQLRNHLSTAVYVAKVGNWQAAVEHTLPHTAAKVNLRHAFSWSGRGLPRGLTAPNTPQQNHSTTHAHTHSHSQPPRRTDTNTDLRVRLPSVGGAGAAGDATPTSPSAAALAARSALLSRNSRGGLRRASLLMNASEAVLCEDLVRRQSTGVVGAGPSPALSGPVAGAGTVHVENSARSEGCSASACDSPLQGMCELSSRRCDQGSSDPAPATRVPMSQDGSPVLPLPPTGRVLRTRSLGPRSADTGTNAADASLKASSKPDQATPTPQAEAACVASQSIVNQSIPFTGHAATVPGPQATQTHEVQHNSRSTAQPNSAARPGEGERASATTHWPRPLAASQQGALQGYGAGASLLSGAACTTSSSGVTLPMSDDSSFGNNPWMQQTQLSTDDTDQMTSVMLDSVIPTHSYTVRQGPQGAGQEGGSGSVGSGVGGGGAAGVGERNPQGQLSVFDRTSPLSHQVSSYEFDAASNNALLLLGTPGPGSDASESTQRILQGFSSSQLAALHASLVASARQASSTSSALALDQLSDAILRVMANQTTDRSLASRSATQGSDTRASPTSHTPDPQLMTTITIDSNVVLSPTTDNALTEPAPTTAHDQPMQANGPSARMSSPADTEVQGSQADALAAKDVLIQLLLSALAESEAAAAGQRAPSPPSTRAPSRFQRVTTAGDPPAADGEGGAGAAAAATDGTDSVGSPNARPRALAHLAQLNEGRGSDGHSTAGAPSASMALWLQQIGSNAGGPRSLLVETLEARIRRASVGPSSASMSFPMLFQASGSVGNVVPTRRGQNVDSNHINGFADFSDITHEDQLLLVALARGTASRASIGGSKEVLKLLGDAYERASVAGGAAVGPGSAGNTGHTTGAPTTAARNALLHILGSVQGSSSSSCAQRGPTHGPQQQHSTAQHSDGRTGETRSTASGGSSGGAAASGASGGGKPHSPVLASMRRATSAALAALGQAFNTTANSAVNSAATDVSGAQSGSGKPEQLSLGQRYVTMKTSKSAANLSELSGMASDTQESSSEAGNTSHGSLFGAQIQLARSKSSSALRRNTSRKRWDLEMESADLDVAAMEREAMERAESQSKQEPSGPRGLRAFSSLRKRTMTTDTKTSPSPRCGPPSAESNVRQQRQAAAEATLQSILKAKGSGASSGSGDVSGPNSALSQQQAPASPRKNLHAQFVLPGAQAQANVAAQKQPGALGPPAVSTAGAAAAASDVSVCAQSAGHAADVSSCTAVARKPVGKQSSFKRFKQGLLKVLGD